MLPDFLSREREIQGFSSAPDPAAESYESILSTAPYASVWRVSRNA